MKKKVLGNTLRLTCMTGCTALIIFCSSCKKEPEVRKVDPELKKYFNYQEGSYWIYRDPVSGMEDSFVVRNNYVYVTTVTNSDAKEEILGCGFAHFRNGIKPSNSIGISLSLIGKKVNMEAITDSGQFIGINYKPLFTYPFQIGELANFGYSDNYAVVTDILDKLSLNGQDHYNVAVVHQYMDNNTLKDHDDWFYINKDAGIVKMKITRTNGMNNTWELVRWNIIRK